MATYIFKSSYGIVFYTPHLHRLHVDMIPFNAIQSIQKKTINGKVRIQLNNFAPSYQNVPEKYQVLYSDVASPETSNVDELITKIYEYNLGFAQDENFTGYSGQTTHTVSERLARDVDRIMLFMDGVLKKEGPDYTYTASTGVVTFASALSGGENITILNVK